MHSQVALKNLPKGITSYFSYLLSLDFVPAVPSEYIDYFNPANHQYDFSKGSITIGNPTSTSLDFIVDNLTFNYRIPQSGGLAESSADGTIDATIKLSGSKEDVDKGFYTKASLEGQIDSRYKVFGDSGIIFDNFSSDQLNLNIEGVFKAKGNSTSINVDNIKLKYSDAGTEWKAVFYIKPTQSLLAEFYENSQLLARVVQDGINEYGLEISSSLLSRFSITDQSLNALLSGQSVQFDDEEVKNIQATLGRSGSDLDPSIEFTRDNTPGSYSVESVIERLIGLANLDIRLIELPAVPNISSEIAPPSVAAVGNIQRTDDDGDGFLEVIVAADGTIVDGNRDGIADATQSQVAGLRLINDGSVGSDYGAISVGEDVQLQDVTLVLAEVEGFIPVTTVGGGTVVTSTPQGVTNAFAGVISFKVAGVTPGGTTSANISFPSGLPADTGNAYLRFNYSTNRFEEFLDANGNPLYTFIDSDGDGTVDGVSLTLTDGDPNWDGDGVANGTVVDPGFLGIGERNLTGTKRGDSLIGNVLANTLSGMNGNDWLEGDLANDVLSGGRGKDRIFGGEGADRITGGKHRDRYYYTDASESSVDQRDTVKFGKNDRFVFTSFDGDTITEGIQTLSFIGKQAFSGTAGELRATRSVLEADTTGDGFANFAVNLRGTPISSDNMVL